LIKFLLPKKAIKAISGVVQDLFVRAKYRLLGPSAPGIRIGTTGQHREDLSLKGVFDSAAKAEGMEPNEKLYGAIESMVGRYFDAHQELAAAKVINAVQTSLHEIENGADAGTTITKALEEAVDKVKYNVRQIAEAETGRAKNLSTLDALSKIALINNVEDPIIVYIGPNDGNTCKDCKRLFFMPDGITPRAWYMSEIGAGYIKHGDSSPSAGCHAHCRHSGVSILPGYGYVGGKLTFIEPGYSLIDDQRGTSK